jgi:hypothetical protein
MFLQQKNSAEAQLEIKHVREKCMPMPKEALSQITCRLPSATDTFESLTKLGPVIILNQISRHMFSELLLIHHAVTNVSKVEKMPFVDWKETPF